jgi:hypothetical protein
MASNRVAIQGVQVNNHFTVFVCGPDTVTVPAPNFDNSEKFEVLRVNRRSRGGDLKVFRAAYWPRTKVLTLQWAYLDYVMRNKIITFLRKNLGKQIVMYAYDDQVYTGVIRTPEAEFIETLAGQHTLKLEFETE